jgi:hypothetical protein
MFMKIQELKQNAEVVEIAPEFILLANTYMKCGSVQEAASSLQIPLEKATQILAKREVRAYVDAVFMDYGFRNRFKLGSALDKIIDKKLEELDEADIGSSKDIADLLQMAHKMRMDEMNLQLKLMEAHTKHDQIKNQVNVQINENNPMHSGNYGELIAKLLTPHDKK